MTSRRPNAVLFAAAFEVLGGLIYLAQMGDVPSFMYRLLLFTVAAGHFYSALGLFMLAEWGRQRTLQFAFFDILAIVPRVFAGHISPWGAVLQLGMPLYILHAMRDKKVAREFS